MEWTELEPDPTEELLRRARAEQAHQAAARYLAGSGLRILARDLRCNETHADIVAAGQRVLVVCQITDRPIRRGPIARAKARRLRLAGLRWMTAHGVLYDEVRVDILRLTHDPGGEYITEHVRGVG
jgi:putative endonuclease